MTDEIGPELEKLLSGLDADRWRDASNEYFARTPQPNALFNILASSWLRGAVIPTLQPDLFRHTVGLVEQWEFDHPTELARHKGTPYYWLGMGYTLLGDLDRAFLYMHLALEEDRRTSGEKVPQMPAFAFVSLDTQTREQAFKEAVDAYAAFIEERLGRYRKDTGGSLTLPALREKVIPVETRWDGMFHLAYATARIRHLELLGPVATKTAFGRNLLGQAIGDICVVAEEWMRDGWPGDGEFLKHAVRFLRSSGVTDAQEVVDSVATAATTDWGRTLEALLDGTHRSPRRPLSAVELDVAAAWQMRNSVAHRVTANEVIAKRFGDIERRVYGAVFAIAEALP